MEELHYFVSAIGIKKYNIQPMLWPAVGNERGGLNMNYRECDYTAWPG